MTGTGPSVIERIAGWSASVRAFPESARRLAGHAIADTVGCMVAGARDEATRSVRAALAGGGVGATALVGGTAAHCLDYDDNFHPARAHASAVLVPALLALAPGAAAGGRALAEAYLVGLEAQAAVGRGVNPSHYNAGWHGTSTVGAIGAAAGAARLLGLDADGIARAMSLAVSMACGPKGQFGTPAKPLHAGLAARAAVESALLARTGMRGRMDILEAPQGFRELFGGKAPMGWDSVAFGSTLAVEAPGVVAKRHPCCGSTHRAIDALLELQVEHGFTAEEVVGIDTKVGLSAVRNLPYADPRDEMEARFSMPYCLAVALTRGRLTLEDFTPAAARRPELRPIMFLVRMEGYTEQEEAGVERLPHRIAVHLRDGRTLRQERLHAKGSSALPLDARDRAEKLADCCRRTLPPARAERLIALLGDLERLDEVSPIAEIIAAAA